MIPEAIVRTILHPPKKVADFLEEAMKQKGKVAVGLSFIAESIDRVGGYSSDIAEVAINLAQ